MTDLATLRAALAPFAAAAPIYAPHPGEALILGGVKGAGRVTVNDFRRAAAAYHDTPAEPGKPEDRL